MSFKPGATESCAPWTIVAKESSAKTMPFRNRPGWGLRLFDAMRITHLMMRYLRVESINQLKLRQHHHGPQQIFHAFFRWFFADGFFGQLQFAVLWFASEGLFVDAGDQFA